jgi:hypothetical protein
VERFPDADAASAAKGRPGREVMRTVNRVLKNVKNLKNSVIPAQAGIQKPLILLTTSHWTPAFAGVTVCFSTPC